jgi:4-amino-4-deoxy-L-arabinose transferase-like glycosyltransferase
VSAVRKQARATGVNDGVNDRDEGDDSPSISHELMGELFGADVESTGPLRYYQSLPVERRQLVLVALGAALMFLPLLGAVGLWDPWESQFAEVGRQMMVRHDWVQPWWEKTWFYSKPPLTMWLTNIGLWLSGAGATTPNQEMGIWADWGVRLPIALLSVAAIAFLYLAAKRLFGQRVGLLSALAAATMPLYCILARQAITDTPFVTLLTMAMCCFLIAEFDPTVKNRDPWLFAFYGLVGLSTLAKEIPFGLGIPGAVVLLYLLLTNDWELLKRVRLVLGGLFCLAIAVPWVLVMCFTRGLEEEGETFVHRYWLHDNFNRLLTGVHTTSPNAKFVYYIEQLGYCMYPWSALLPGALGVLLGLDPKVKADRAKVFVGVWALIPFVVISLAATKFEHYAFPCMPPLAILLALYVDKLWREGLRPHTFSLLMAAALFAMIGQNLWETPKILTDLFTYNPDRPYPTNLIADPWPIIGTLFAVGAVLAVLGMVRGKGKARNAGLVTLGAGFLLYLRIHLTSTGWSAMQLSSWTPREVMGGIFLAFGVLAAASALTSQRAWFLAAVAGCAIAFSGYLSWVHWEQLSAHWTQREIFHTYFTQRRGDEPIAAYQMNWKGETYYGKNLAHQIQDPNKMREFLREPAGTGGRHWVVTDSRPQYWKPFQQLVAAEGKHLEVKDDSDVKFFLVTVE